MTSDVEGVVRGCNGVAFSQLQPFTQGHRFVASLKNMNVAQTVDHTHSMAPSLHRQHPCLKRMDFNSLTLSIVKRASQTFIADHKVTHVIEQASHTMTVGNDGVGFEGTFIVQDGHADGGIAFCPCNMT